jgi:hypothetical protein
MNRAYIIFVTDFTLTVILLISYVFFARRGWTENERAIFQLSEGLYRDDGARCSVVG